MAVDIREETLWSPSDYGGISPAFWVTRVVDVETLSEGTLGTVAPERNVARPYVKDYDAIPGEGPSTWAQRFDMSNWGVIGARVEGTRIGGAVVAFDTQGVEMLEGRSDLAVLWDIRVATEWRGKGVGARLFAASESWAQLRGARELKVETQNINVAACRFYARQGCELRAIVPSAYPELPEEVQLLWYKDLNHEPHTDADPTTLRGEGRPPKR